MIICKQCDAKNPNDNAFCENCGEPLSSGDTIGGIPTPPHGGGGPSPSPTQNTELEPGTTFAGRYTVVERIGQGGMGTVYKASETLAGKERLIALKLIRSDRIADERAMDKLVSEGALTQDIRHANVVNVYNVGVEEDRPFVAMELVKGVSLREWHRRQIGAGHDVPFDTAAAIVREVLAGLEAAHALDIIHRDLKPENIMLTSEPGGADVKLKILDFGIARAPGTVETGTGIGTPHYMAPEQITNPDSAGPPADFYSVFKIWYELLMDVLPQGHWQPPSSGRPDVEPLVDQLIERGLSAKPSRRPKDVAQFRKWMGRAIPGFPGLGGDDTDHTPRPDPTPTPRPYPAKDNSNTSAFELFNPKQTGLGCLAVLGILFILVILIAIIDGDDDADDDYYEDDARADLTNDEVQVEEPVPAEEQVDPIEPDEMPTQAPPPPPPPQLSYSDLGGRWNVTPGGFFDARVADNGEFQAQGQNANGVPLQIIGNIAAGTYAVGNQVGSRPGRISWDQGCHLAFTTFNQDGSVNLSGMFHIDHAPNADCPARFRR